MDDETQIKLLLRNNTLIDGMDLTETLINRIMYICTKNNAEFPVLVGTNPDTLINVALNHLISSLLAETYNNRSTDNLINSEIEDIKRTYVNDVEYFKKREYGIIASYIDEFQGEYEDEDEDVIF